MSERELRTFRITNGGLIKTVKADHVALTDGVMVLYRDNQVVAMVPQTTGCVVVEEIEQNDAEATVKGA